MQLSQPALIDKVSVRLDGGSPEVNALTGLRFDFRSPIPLSRGCTILVTIPTDFGVDRRRFEKVQVFGMFGVFRQLPFTVMKNNVVEVRGACGGYTDNQLNATLKVKYLRNPSTIRKTGTFNLQVKNSQG